MTEAKEISKLIKDTAKGFYDADGKNMRQLAKIVATGDGKKAYKYFRHMDTIVREWVPEKAFNYLCLHRTKTRKEVPFVVKLKGCKQQIGDKKDFAPGEIYKGVFEFPGDITDHELGRSLCDAQDKLVEELVEIEFKEPTKKTK
jgi:hypothetical protein